MIKDLSEVWHNGSETSKEAAFNAIPRVPTQKEKVKDFVKRNPGSSRQEIADGTGITLQAVCARVATLLQEKNIVEDEETKIGDYGTSVKKLMVLTR